MESYWRESSPLAKTAVGLALAGAAGAALYIGVQKIHAGVTTPQKARDTPACTMVHEKCRTGKYPRGNIDRFHVPVEKVPWSTDFPGYSPVLFTSESVAAQPVWADLDYLSDKSLPPAEWNTVDGKVDRRSHNGEYAVIDGLPRNPVGRTGMHGRGTLGRWGPNHAADPIVTRWKRNKEGNMVVHPKTNKTILQFVAIKRRDSGMWAIPGGMVDPGEKVSVTLKREFSEEALNALEMPAKERAALEESINDLFKHGTQVYQGYVDDPRNTDNSWMETIAVNFHDPKGETIGRVHLNAGDDAVGVQWTDMDSQINLYASHSDFIKQVCTMLDAHW